jgi:hypothetical protein
MSPPQVFAAALPPRIVLQARAASALALVVAGLMLVLAVPRFFGALAAAPHGAIAALLDKPELVSDAALARARAAYSRALLSHDAPQHQADLGALDLALAQRRFAAGEENAARQALAASIADQRLSLAAEPLQAYVWTRLAQAELRDATDLPAAARALAMAIETAPWEPALVMARIGLSLRYGDEFAPDLRSALDLQIRHAARFYPTALAHQARQYRAQDQVLRALETDADLLRRFSLAYSRI